ncbi:regulator of G-protein signaling 22 isoform X2 [Oryzias latipes]|uniref:regulator of G-protein signaling 22 isoform X2 n=1 Tax=Oryzias latipes TaxID=8090 RepID=UPI000CE25E6A|nr:regulator of G-protein signaling 22 isoform X2 [Oryzias latipes]
MCEVFSSDFSHLSADNFESRLASDDLLVHFFNDFLSLKSFSEDVLYNRESGRLEVLDGAAERVSRAIRTALLRTKSKLLSGDPSVLTNTSPVENHYTVCCLDRQQGMRWITRERLPFFLQSDCFFEYKLAKLLLQSYVTLCSRRRNRNAPQTPPPHLDGGNISPSEASLSQSQGCSFPHSVQEECVGSQSEQERLLPDLAAGVREEALLRTSYHQTPDDLLDGGGSQVSSDALYAMDGQSAVNKDESKRHCTSTENEGEEGAERDEKNEGIVKLPEEASAVCWHCRGDGKAGLEEFKEFLRGTPAEHLLELWMDIERLKTTCRDRKERYLVLMRSRYLHCSSLTSLRAELLSRLGLSTSPCWTEEKLHAAQSSLTESLFCYWALRFWTSQHAQRISILEQKAANCCSIPLWVGCGSVPVFHPVRSSYLSSTTPQLSRRSQLQRRKGRSEMLKALCVEFYAGFYFTRFCEQSGNQRWINAIYFWTDLQHFHQLFYQEGLDPFTVQREAQLLNFTYVFSLARRSLGVDEEIRREVHHRLRPAFEELFDRVEEHVLNILQEAWTQLLRRDEESFQQVCVQEVVRCINSEEYQELQSLNKESERRKNEVEHCSSNLFPLPATFFNDSNPSQALGLWACVPPSYRGYRLSFLMDERQELIHFMSFLRDHEASVHLMCWLDMEQFQTSPQKEAILRQERWQRLASKYLNEEYFFGAGSPATGEQQQQIVRLAGGPERLQSQCLPNAAIQEIQDIVRNHIEETWLPSFLATPEFTKRQKDKVKGADRLSQHVRHRRQTRREASEAQGMRMSASTEIRQVLLHPSSCQQFLNFVSLKGDFLENDVRFWLEVQRYKDLCHSHSDEATIQQKISIIISCFINSSMPPALQIDIPPDQAQRILEERHQLGPYIFREAQMSVFNELMTVWPEFQDFRSSVGEEQLLSVLEQKRAGHRARVRRQRRKEEEEEEEERRTQELKLQELSLLEEADYEDKEEGVGKESLRRPSRAQLMETRPLLWSYSKYMAGLQKEEVLLRRQSQLEASSSTSAGASD